VTLLFAHAFGARYDLPVPLGLFVFGGAAVVFLSFLLILPTRVEAATGHALGPALVDRSGRSLAWSRGRSALMGVIWVVLAALIVAGFAGTQEVAENILPTFFWLLIWVGVPISCGLVGDWTRYVNPFAAIAHLAGRESVRRVVISGSQPMAWPRRLGWWPATVLFFVLACGELIYNDTATLPNVVALGLVMYALVTATAAVVFGAEAWLERGEVFSVLFATWGRLGWFRFGAPGPRGFLGGLWEANFEASVSRVAFVLLLLVSVSFDGLLSTPTWKQWRLSLPLAYQVGTTGYKIGETIAFVLLLLLIWAVLQCFAYAVDRVGRLGLGSFGALAGLLPSMLPIAFGYLFSHNADYLAINGQLLMPLLGNPVGSPSWPHLGYPFNDSYEVNLNLVPTSAIWYFQVVLIVLVHIAAILIAHRHLGHAVERRGLSRPVETRRLARLAEWPWIVAMVCYTVSSLWLLAQPLVAEG
jgi:hypothetical protein